MTKLLCAQVQRVKNKWKITLRDGVVSAEGKDYLFHKCQGSVPPFAPPCACSRVASSEFEW